MCTYTYLYIYICVCAFLYIGIHMHLHTHIGGCILVYRYFYIYIYMYKHIYIYIYIYIHVHDAYTGICMHVYAFIMERSLLCASLQLAMLVYQACSNVRIVATCLPARLPPSAFCSRSMRTHVHTRSYYACRLSNCACTVFIHACTASVLCIHTMH